MCVTVATSCHTWTCQRRAKHWVVCNVFRWPHNLMALACGSVFGCCSCAAVTTSAVFADLYAALHELPKAEQSSTNVWGSAENPGQFQVFSSSQHVRSRSKLPVDRQWTLLPAMALRLSCARVRIWLFWTCLQILVAWAVCRRTARFKLPAGI